MDNRNSIEKVNQSRFGDHFIKPLYGSYCFSHIPGTILKALGAEDRGYSPLPDDVFPAVRDYQSVILLFVDAFGWRFLERYCSEVPLQPLKSLREQGIASKITSQFPSTTAAHVTTIHTGLPVSDTGVYEWYYYENRIDQVISPLLFSRPGEKGRNTLLQYGVSAADFLPATSIYSTLKNRGIASCAYQYQEYAGGPYSQQVMQGAEIEPYADYRMALKQMAERVLQANEKQYLFFYFDKFDSSLHLNGPNTTAPDEVAREFFQSLYECLLKPLANKGSDALLLLTADHGMVNMNFETTVNLDVVMPELINSIKTDREGRPLIPAGSARDAFLHVKETDLDRVYTELTALLRGKAEVHLTESLIEAGIFGVAGAALKANLGNITILPYAGESVFWRGENGEFAKPFLGHHGGMTPEEMESVFLALDLKEWRQA